MCVHEVSRKMPCPVFAIPQRLGGFDSDFWSAPMAKPITVIYWPMLARGASLVRMLEHTNTPYDST